MNQYVTKVHRGVDNEIQFRVLNRDRKTVSVDHLSIRAKLINPQNGERVLERYCDLASTKGDVRLRIREGDLVNIAPGFYNLVVTGAQSLVPGNSLSEDYYTPLYVDGGYNIVGTVEVVDHADPTPFPTVTLLPNNWTPNGTKDGPNIVMRYYSSAIPGARVKNYINGVHTFAVYTTNFSGTLRLVATLDLNPPENYNDYFPIDITTATDVVEFTNYTGVNSYTFEANAMYFRFIYSPTSLNVGTLDKIMLR
jgi:hypothetical protein